MDNPPTEAALRTVLWQQFGAAIDMLAGEQGQR